MASVSYSFVDIAVLDRVRERFAAGDALAILSTGLDVVIWANGAGAALFGHDSIEAAIGAEPVLPVAARRQIAATPGFPDLDTDRTIALRLGRGIVTLHVGTVDLPDGERAILLARTASSTRMQDDDFRAAAAVQGFDAAGQFAALIDGEGQVAAASSGFGGLGIATETLVTLVAEVRDEADRLVKRVVDGSPRRLPAAFARLTDAPAMHLLIVVDEQNDAPQYAPQDLPPATAAEREADPAPATLASEPGPDEPEEAGEDAPDLLPEETATERSGPDAQDEHGIEADASADTTVTEAAAPRPSGTVRFAWRTDAEGRFTALSDAFAEAVGPAAADVMGRRFREVSNAFGLDPDGRISALLERRDTWSGRTVLWPLAGTNQKVPVDLAALPIYGRGRVFEGFHGFGLARMGDAVTDPEGIGLVLTPGAAMPPPRAPSGAADHNVEAPEAPLPAEADTPAAEEKPALSISAMPGRRESDKVIRLAEHRGPQKDGALTPTEQIAFLEIGDRLRRDSGDDAAAQAEAAPEDRSPDETLEADDASRTEAVGEHDAAASATDASDASEAIDDPARDAAVEPDLQASVADDDGGEPVGTEAPHDAPASPDALQTLSGITPKPAFLPSAFHGATPGSRTAAADTTLLTHLPLPILIHAGDVLHYANQAFFDLTGYPTLADLHERGGLDVLFPDAPSPAGGPHGVSMKTADGMLIDVHAHLQSVPWGQGKALLLALSRSETPQPAREAAAVAQTPDMGADDREEGKWPAAARDNVETAELEMHLAEMRAIVDTATDGVAIIDNDGTVRSANAPAEALFGFDSADVVGKPFTALFAIESQRAVQEHLNGLSDNGVASVLNDGLEVIGREAQGRFIPLFMTIGRLPRQSGFCAVLRDITQWKRAAEELTQARAEAERASSQKTEFLARVSHEIRTPLNAIIGFSELMIDEKFGPIGNDRYRDYLRDINRSGNHVLDLVNDLLDISKIEAGEQEMHYEAVPLNDVLGQTVAMMQPQANRERVIIRSSFASNLPDVVADPRSVRQIALNLLSNATRYTAAGGQVIVSTAYGHDGSVVMRVRDTGIGMSPAEIDEALKPFKQINSLKRKRGEGTGLGLPLTRAMVEANRASFAISSVPGEGTLVEVTFPPTRVLAD
ncbi:PAS domain-containing sensor histidine kinase [Nitratireductor pacificus]|uniref:histidine kinase n=1 Tax=Nitratireductor pacificus pht-3B TaxID=391937 RepID=K2MEP7_9HYPH|nr:PAS domain-containing sensor histidine kinase [Nitratireductor pacificus]EKF20596.1 PAS/PAC sensor signal transduction histidine kinase [Nitratireductor pacificus pht-3B]